MGAAHPTRGKSMKLQKVIIGCRELQDYLDKYQDKIKFIFHISEYCRALDCGPNQILLIIDME